jgi:dTDP-4-amino-4,6-dideoxygalactose transaminase
MIPIARPDIGPEEVAAVTEVLTSGMIAQGRKVAELEERWAEYIGVPHAIAMSNGTTALMSVFAGLGLGPGDEVITVAHTFAATANAILYTGATPVFVDIEPDTYLIDAARIEAAITPRTRAICPVHLFGLVADMDMIRAIADRHGLAVVEDACQAHGATFRGRRAGSFGEGVFSLYATKNMTSAEGGIVTTRDDALADWLRLYRNQGMRSRYSFEMLGYNFRLTDVAAAIGLAQFAKLERNTARRRQVARAYDAAFADLPVRRPVSPTGRVHVFHQYTLDVGAQRDSIIEAIREGGVGADIYYPLPVHRQTYILERGLYADLPVTDAAAAHTLALPMYPGLTEDEQRTVIDVVRRAVLEQADVASADPATSPIAAGAPRAPEAAAR